jgi:anti-anti-sigma factor
MVDCGDAADLPETAAAVGTVNVALEPGQSVVALAGEIDLAAESVLNEACRLVLGRGLPVRIDATAMTFIDSRGVGLLVPILQGRPGGRRPVLVGASRLVLEIITVMGVADLVELV